MKPLNAKPAEVVEVTQTVQTREGPWQTRVRGKVLSCVDKPTGSWFAHGKNDRLWLRRLRLQKDDGEIVEIVLDETSDLKVIDAGK